jgi:cytochrome c oxidase cbb3-type subunit 3
MPVVALPERDIELLTMYTLSLRRRDLPETYSPKDRVRVVRFGEREFASDGATIFGAFCSGCHGPDGLGRRSPGMPAFPSPANPDFLALASDEFIRETIRLGRLGRRMPAWGQKDGGLRPDEIDKVVAHLRRLGGVPAPARTAGAKASGDTATGSRLFAAACAGCHGPEGLGGEGPALNNPVLLATATDEFLIETIARGRRGTAMEGFLEPSVARRTLSRGEIESIVTFIRSLQGDKKK